MSTIVPGSEYFESGFLSFNLYDVAPDETITSVTMNGTVYAANAYTGSDGPYPILYVSVSGRITEPAAGTPYYATTNKGVSNTRSYKTRLGTDEQPVISAAVVTKATSPARITFEATTKATAPLDPAYWAPYVQGGFTSFTLTGVTATRVRFVMTLNRAITSDTEVGTRLRPSQFRGTAVADYDEGGGSADPEAPPAVNGLRIELLQEMTGQVLNLSLPSIYLTNRDSVRVPAGRRVGNVVLDTTRGARRTWSVLDTVTLNLEIAIRPVLDTGLTSKTKDAARVLDENAQRVLRWLSSEAFTIRATREDGVRMLLRQCQVQTSPDYKTTGRVWDRSTITVAVTSLEGSWVEDGDARTSTIGVSSAGFTDAIELAGTSSPIDDAIITFFGPARNPVLTDLVTGTRVYYLGDVTGVSQGGVRVDAYSRYVYAGDDSRQNVDWVGVAPLIISSGLEDNGPRLRYTSDDGGGYATVSARRRFATP